MKLIRHFLYVSAAAALVLTSCAKTESESYDKYEKIALGAWMQKYRPELVQNFQPVGDLGYYVDVLDPGASDAKPLSDEDTWVSFDFSGRDLNGNIILTRRSDEARLGGTFSKYTHYVPYYRYCGSENSGLLEGAYLAMRNKLVLGQEYADKNGLPTEVRLRYGAKVVLYMPSMLVGSNGVEGSGGYQGPTSLSSQRPFRVELMIRDTVKNPLQREGTSVDGFSKDNGGLLIYNKDDSKIPTDPEDPTHPYNPVSPRWVSACDTVAQLYVNYRFDPKVDKFVFPVPYADPNGVYNDPAGIEQQISEALVKRFHTDEEYKGVAALGADSVKLDGTAKIWYIGRFLDGFIFDTNIDEVKKIIYGKVESTGSALSYKPSDETLIKAFYYTVPNLQYGQWATLITTSTYGYGSQGKEASTTTSSSGGNSSSSYLDYSNYLNYANNYYGGYYGGYYDNYYGNNYNGGYYGDYYGSGYDSSGATTTTKVSTEIAPFMPLIFEFYVEPKED